MTHYKRMGLLTGEVVRASAADVSAPSVPSQRSIKARLGSYEIFLQGEALTETVWEKLMLGFSTRRYDQAVRQFTEAYELERSTVSEFIEASRSKLKEMLERCLEKTHLCAWLIYATASQGQQMVRALGIDKSGRKLILGIRQGRRESHGGDLLGDLAERGLDFNQPRLYIRDGGNARIWR